MSCSLITRIASRRKSGSKPSPTLRRYSSSATLTSVIGPSFVVDLHTHEEAPMTVCCQPLFTPPAETLSGNETTWRNLIPAFARSNGSRKVCHGNFYRAIGIFHERCGNRAQHL